ncbi:hypothetical protein [Methylobacterium sp. WCS2018Hpa-22]|uniref:hypothetical protein n=1 Tax=Methylobacterium sp. WCS2018Hpa-22 TaxID=3073633 RepID=UPI00288A6A86|nr:hypothetical protein [Methylobacterium sp. WCS2018Hpa-22]
MLTSSVGDGVSVNIAAGRVYDGGKQYALEEKQVRSVATYVPTIAGRSVICLVIAQGDEVSDNMENRYYERAIDPKNPNAGVQQSVDDGYRTKNRKVVVSVIPSVEAARPAAPAAPTGAVAVAEILVTTSGIQKITMRDDTKAKRLDSAITQIADIVNYLDEINQSIDGLRADLAAVAAKTGAPVAMAAIGAIENDLANVKAKLGLPVDDAPYYTDNFLDYEFSDWNPETQKGNVDFDARIEEGIRFAYEAESTVALSLLNPNDPNVMHVGRGLICPAYTEVAGLSVAKASGDMPLGGVSVQTVTVKTLTKSVTRIRYGTGFTVSNSSNFWKGGGRDSINGLFRDAKGVLYSAIPIIETNKKIVGSTRLRQIFKDTILESYEKLLVKEKTVSGVVKAETFLMANERWVTGTDLGIKRWGAGASITASVCECDNSGRPDPTRAVQTVTLTEAQFKAWPAWTSFDFDEPAMLGPLSTEDGRARPWAVVWYTVGDVDVMTADGSRYTAGTLLSTTDMQYFDPDITKDICFRLRYAKFNNSDLTVRLGSWNLSGGIENIDILASILAPNSSTATFEIFVGNRWRKLDNDEAGASFIGGTQALYEARVVLHGNMYSMPIIDTIGSRVRCSRPKGHLDWIGTDFGLGGTATEIKVRALVGAYDSARHTLKAALRYGSGYGTVKAPTGAPKITVAPGRAKTRVDQESAVEVEWTFSFTSAVSAVKPELIIDTNNYKIPCHVEQITVRKSA